MEPNWNHVIAVIVSLAQLKDPLSSPQLYYTEKYQTEGVSLSFEQSDSSKTLVASISTCS